MDNLSLYQIFIPFLSFIMMLYAISLYRRKKKTFKECVIWFLFWSLLSLFALFPDLTYVFARITGIQDNVNAVVFISIALLFFIVFKLIIVVESLEQKISKMVRHEAKKQVHKK